MRIALALSTLAAATAAAALGPAGPAATAGQPRSPAVYPEQRIALPFNHKAHLYRGTVCTVCHPGVTTSESAQDRLVPGEDRCARCHQIAEAKAGRPHYPPGQCPLCHVGFDATVHRAPEASAFPRAAIHFSHAKHLARLAEAGEKDRAACAACHGSYDAVELATRAQLPKMTTCLVCHDGRKAPADCTTCHLRAVDAMGSRVETRLPGGVLRPGPGDPLGLDHGPSYDRAHGLAALGRREQCLACHSEPSCMSCHDGTKKPASIHPGDFISTHPVPARANQPNCAACHRLQSFCVACHERAGVSPNADPSLYVGGNKVHPAGWMTPGPAFHGVQAARNIGQCASCHQEQQCLQCHSTSSALYPGGIRPHPPGFASRCGEMIRKNARSCEKCHVLSNPADSAAKCR